VIDLRAANGDKVADFQIELGGTVTPLLADFIFA